MHTPMAACSCSKIAESHAYRCISYDHENHFPVATLIFKGYIPAQLMKGMRTAMPLHKLLVLNISLLCLSLPVISTQAAAGSPFGSISFNGQAVKLPGWLGNKSADNHHDVKPQGTVSLRDSLEAGLISSKPRRSTLAADLKSRPYAGIIHEKARKYDVHPELVHAVIQAESAYNPRAVSPAGAVGLMQLMPQTAQRFGVSDSTNPRQNIDGGVRYLRFLLDYFDNNMRLAVAGYNAGEEAVVKHGHRIPPYAETRQYVTRVMKYLQRNLDQTRSNSLTSLAPRLAQQGS
jgi:hypothetical protein